MSEQVRQRQVILNEGKTLVNTKGVYSSKFGNETHFLSFAAIVATRTNNKNFNIFTCIKIRVLSTTNSPPPRPLIPDEGPLVETSNLFFIA